MTFIEILVGTLLAAALGAGADRLRGTDKLPALAAKVIYAVLAASVVCTVADGYWVIWFVVTFVAGSSYGWGRPLGLTLGGQNNPEPERWQKGFLLDTRYALVARGLMWLTPVLPLFFITGNVMYAIAPVVMTVAFVVSPYLANLLPEKGRWASMEMIRGALFVGTCFVCSLVL